ncbi:hypothetical protein D3C78_1723180 [compost metagenome]
MIWVNCTPTKAQEQAYNALQAAADRMGRNNYNSQYTAHIKAGRSKNTFRYSVTGEHALVVEYMPKVLSGEVTPEEAYALLWNYDVKNQRLNT